MGWETSRLRGGGDKLTRNEAVSVLFVTTVTIDPYFDFQILSRLLVEEALL